MRHRIKGKKLGRVSKVRRSLLKNLLKSLLIHGSIKTTYAKAKALLPLAEKFCHRAVEGTLNSKRYMYKYLQDRNWVSQVEKAILKSYPDTKSNFIRIVKIANRIGDDAPIAKISFTKAIDFSVDIKKEEKKPDSKKPIVKQKKETKTKKVK